LTASRLAYLDASAFVKLAAPEPESPALETELRDWPHAVASELLAVEAKRFGQRYGGSAPWLVEAALRRITLIPLAGEIREVAASVVPPELRSLAAIHLATALTLGAELVTFFVYDHRLAGRRGQRVEHLASRPVGDVPCK